MRYVKTAFVQLLCQLSRNFCVTFHLTRCIFMSFDFFFEILSPNERSDLGAFGIRANSTVVQNSSNDILLKFRFSEISTLSVLCVFEKLTVLLSQMVRTNESFRLVLVWRKTNKNWVRYTQNTIKAFFLTCAFQAKSWHFFNSMYLYEFWLFY